MGIIQDDSSLYKMLLNSSLAYPSKIAVKDNALSLSYSDLVQHSWSLGQALREYGVQPGDLIGVLLRNTCEFVISAYGIYSIGAVLVPIDQDTTSATLILKSKIAKIKVLISEEFFNEVLEKALREIPSIKFVVYKADDSSSHWASTEVLKWGEWNNLTVFADQYWKCSDELAEIIFTTGTTGILKAAKLTHRQIHSAILNIVQMANLSEFDVEVNALPLVRMFGQMNLMSYQRVGGTVLIESGLGNPINILQKIKKNEATGFSHVPSAFLMFMNNYCEEFKKHMENLRYVMMCSMPMSSNDIQRLMQMLPKSNILNTYGLTECVRATCVNYRANKSKIGSVGKPINGAVKIVDRQSGIFLPPYQNGEIVLDMPQVFSGYLNDELETANSIKLDGLHTGDIGYVDEEGFLYYVGRDKDFVNVGGRKFHPCEVEELVDKMTEVKRSFVLPIPDPEQILGEIPSIIVVLNDNASVSIRQIQQYLLGKIETYKIPRFLFLFPEEKLPYTETGKIKRSLLKKIIESEKSTNV